MIVQYDIFLTQKQCPGTGRNSIGHRMFYQLDHFLVGKKVGKITYFLEII